ncbi:unnamed protein product, partial [marine sediment metagenome]
CEIYCSECVYYVKSLHPNPNDSTTDKCDSPDNIRSTYRDRVSGRALKPSVKNKENNCSEYKPKGEKE